MSEIDPDSETEASFRVMVPEVALFIAFNCARSCGSLVATLPVYVDANVPPNAVAKSAELPDKATV